MQHAGCGCHSGALTYEHRPGIILYSEPSPSFNLHTHTHTHGSVLAPKTPRRPRALLRTRPLPRGRARDPRPCRLHQHAAGRVAAADRVAVRRAPRAAAGIHAAAAARCEGGHGVRGRRHAVARVRRGCGWALRDMVVGRGRGAAAARGGGEEEEGGGGGGGG